MSRELDALVAEKVMGWELKGGVWWDREARPALREDKYWHPSTSIADTWLVVEEMRRQGFSMEYCEDPGEPYRVWFQVSDDVLTCGRGISDTATEAICRAALEAVKE